MKEILVKGFAEMGLTASPEALEKLEEYARLLLQKNQVMNLTAIQEPEQVARLHFLDSAAILAYGVRCPDSPLLGESPSFTGRSWLSGKSVLDVGTGAGFPGLVLQILDPSLKLVLLDSLGKRMDWLGEVCQTLELNQVQRVCARAEEQALLPGFRDSFDVTVSRAVASLPRLTELCLPFVKIGGTFLAMKGAGSDEEVATAQHAVRRLGGEEFQIWDYPISGTERVHRLAVARKQTATPNGYPRKWGKIKRAPL